MSAKTVQQEMQRAMAMSDSGRIEVIKLCERLGFGFVMSEASREWRRRDPIGAIALGECYNGRTEEEAEHSADSARFGGEK